MKVFSPKLVTIAIMALAGCKGGAGSEAKITGTVKFQGKPVTCGYVLLKFDNNNEVNGNIANDGTFVVHTVERGHAKIAVGSPKPTVAKNDGRGGAPDPTAPDPSKWFEIPAKYADPDASGKDATITGNQTLDITLD